MNLQLTGHHVEITPAIRDYVVSKLERINRHFEQVIEVKVIMSVQKLDQMIEATVHLSGKDIHANIVELVEEMLVSRALEECGGNQVQAAQLLGISRNTLRHRMAKYNLNSRSTE